MRASSVSPFSNRAPDPGTRVATPSADGPLVGMFAMSRYGAGAVRSSGLDGFTSNRAAKSVTGHEAAAGLERNHSRKTARATDPVARQACG